MPKKLSPADEFEQALVEHGPDYGCILGPGEYGKDARAALRAYFETVMAWNPRLHLVAPCSPSEFATRHVLESVWLSLIISDAQKIVDVGSGAGLPIIPCLIAQEHFRATIYESSQKKAVFLREALRAVGRQDAATVVAKRFEETEPPAADALTCRAIDRFGEILPELFAWSSGVQALYLLGGENLREKIEAAAFPFEAVPVPRTERSFLYCVLRNAPPEPAS
jgi:16S rRNA (guanine527-N7)-methyltransferase